MNSSKFNVKFLLAFALVALSAQAAEDPFHAYRDVAAAVTGYQARPCDFAAPTTQLSLPEVVDRALCGNPQTREAWMNARVAAAQLGSAQSGYLPSVSVNASMSRGRSAVFVNSANNASLGVTLNYLLFDFGARDAQTDAARAALEAASRGQDSVVNTVFLSAVQNYYQYFAAVALVEAQREAEHAAQESFSAADARYKVGTITRADVLQAQTAYSQARLNRLRAEGDARQTQGALMSIMGLPADAGVAVAAPSERATAVDMQDSVRRLIETAQRQRPDLQAAQAQVRAAQAGVKAAAAAGKPSLSVSASSNYQRSDNAGGTGALLGLNLSMPLFTGYNTTYKIRAAQELVGVREAQQAGLANDIALQVWRAWQSLATEESALGASEDLLASATASAQLALGRYRAGVGNILDVLNAQSSLASARNQRIQSVYNWRLVKVALAQAVGQLGLNELTDAGQN